jgi:hypothetical protein
MFWVLGCILVKLWIGPLTKPDSSSSQQDR